MTKHYCNICQKELPFDFVRKEAISGKAEFLIGDNKGPGGTFRRERLPFDFKIEVTNFRFNCTNFHACDDCVAGAITKSVKEMANPPMAVKIGTEEGDKCNRDGCLGVIEFKKDGECNCHTNPPCHACENSFLACPKCQWEAEH